MEIIISRVCVSLMKHNFRLVCASPSEGGFCARRVVVVCDVRNGEDLGIPYSL